MGNRIALRCARVFDQRARGAGCGGHAGEPERRQIVGIELAAQRARRGFDLELPLRQAPHSVSRIGRQVEAGRLRDQYLGGSQPLEFGGESVRFDLGCPEASRREREPRDADAILLRPQREQQVVALVVEQRRIGQRAGRDYAQYLALDRPFGRGGIADLLANRHRLAELDQLR